MGNRGRPRKVVQDEPDEEVSFNKTAKHAQIVHSVTKSAPSGASGRLTRAKTSNMTEKTPALKKNTTKGNKKPDRRDANHVTVSESRSVLI
jgi:hypothetical protein